MSTFPMATSCTQAVKLELGEYSYDRGEMGTSCHSTPAFVNTLARKTSTEPDRGRGIRVRLQADQSVPGARITREGNPELAVNAVVHAKLLGSALRARCEEIDIATGLVRI
eukprot:5079683-Prymnesium_polylepis.2